MKRYNLLDGESYGKKYQMVEEKYGDWVWWEDVEEIEALNAKLLEDLKYIENAVKIGLPSGSILEIVKVSRKAARAAIAKAKGEQP